MSWMDAITDDVQSQAKEESTQSYEPIPSGTYSCEIEAARITETKKDGSPVTPHIAFTLKILDGDFKGRKLWPNMYLSPKAYPITVRILETGGYTIAGPQEIEKVLEHMVEREWDIEIKQRPNDRDASKPFFNIESFSEKIPF